MPWIDCSWLTCCYTNIVWKAAHNTNCRCCSLEIIDELGYKYAHGLEQTNTDETRTDSREEYHPAPRPCCWDTHIESQLKRKSWKLYATTVHVLQIVDQCSKTLLDPWLVIVDTIDKARYCKQLTDSQSTQPIVPSEAGLCSLPPHRH